MPAGPVCSKQLGTITMAGGVGVTCLLGAWFLQALFKSRALLQLSTGLAVTGRLIALGTLGAVVLILVLYTQFSDAL